MVLTTTNIHFSTAWLACGLDRVDLAHITPTMVEARCTASQYIDTADAYRDQDGVLHVHVTGARPAFYAMTDDQVCLISNRGKVMKGHCLVMPLDLPIVTFHDVIATEPAFQMIARNTLKLMHMLRQYAKYRPGGLLYRPFTGFTVAFTDPHITIDLGEKGLKRKLKMVPGLIRKAASSTGFPAHAVLVDSTRGTWAALSSMNTGKWRHR